MLSKILFSAALLVTGAFSTPVVHPRVSEALARGIDLAEQIPGDAIPIPGGGYSFEWKTEAGAWVRAQMALGESSTKIGIALFSYSDCSEGRGVWFPDVQYGLRHRDIVPARYWGVGIAGRALKDNEVLKFKQRGHTGDRDYCEIPISEMTNTSTGCFEVLDINCFILETK